MEGVSPLTDRRVILGIGLCLLGGLGGCAGTGGARERYFSAQASVCRGHEGSESIAYFPELDLRMAGRTVTIVTSDAPLPGVAFIGIEHEEPELLATMATVIDP